MSRRLAMIARILGALGMLGGVYLVLASWAVALPAYEVSRAVVPQLIFSEPLIWLGVALLLAPTLARLAAESDRNSDASLQADGLSAAYMHCPQCEQLVRLDADHCRYCGEKLVGPSAQPARTSPPTPAS